MPHPPANVIWITTDHLRWDCLAAHGTPWMHTPHLNRLVAGGVSFERCYGQSPICMPSRCSFMTGCYPQQTGVMDNGQELPADFAPTVAHCFAAGLHFVARFGRKHDDWCGGEARIVTQLSEEPGCYEDAYRTWLRGEHPDQVERFTVHRPSTPQRLNTDGLSFRVLDAPWQCSHSGWVSTQAIRVWRGGAGNRRGQFMHMGFYATHPPLNPTREMFAPYRDIDLPDPIPPTSTRIRRVLPPEQLRAYRRHFAAMVTGVDFAVGALLAELEARRELDDTLLVFGSDHGDLCGDHGGISKGDSFYDGIMRVPLVLHWPNGLKTPGRRIAGLTELIDVLPTLLGLCLLPIPPAMSGRDLSWPLLAGEEVPARRDAYAVHGPGHVMLRTEDWCYLRYARGEAAEEVMYHLRDDPQELTDLAAEPGYAQALAELRDRAFTRTVQATRSGRIRRMRY